ncbi:alpha-1,2-fucosyltransferase [Desulfocurvibacter africanus]|uniref:alpha-1,2-fucosyltransferase n=1 Tax=Desulfocurvibacter africanus TaxID=873 RepID=UPI000551AE9C|nr:alpha-1,2-fucosyltransferase [Desulfocurvibacter africanus]
MTVGVWILGGLGNQMFQYAMAWSLSRRIGADVRLDLSGFKSYSLRRYALSAFGINADLWEGPSPISGRRMRLRDRWQSLADKGLAPKPGFRLVRERNFFFDPSIKNLNENCYLYGYWQSALYFDDFGGEIRRIFDPTRFAHSGVAAALADVEKPLSVSVHLRRGDYILSSKTQATHGLCEMDYYERAARLMRRCVPGCRFHIFSDDPYAASEMFSGWADALVMDSRSQEEDLLLMSHCQHHIIANSSFSWWAAWLDNSPECIVIAPRNWFTRSVLLRTPVLDLFPDDWILL